MVLIVAPTAVFPNSPNVRLTPRKSKKAGGDNDGDSDDGGAKAVQAAPKPTVNLNGQKIGQLINVSA
jgi:hypothetical protein